MPARTEEHAQGGAYRAVFHFICRDPANLDGVSAPALIAQMLELARRDAGVRYRDFRGIVEGDARTFPAHRYILPGYAAWAHLRDTDTVLRQKLADEQVAHKRVKGHVSYKPPVHLTRETCALVIGSRAFLFENARLYLEERGVLGDKLLDLGQVICSLKSVREEPRADDYVQVNLWERAFYPANFDALAERVFKNRLSQDDMLARIGRVEC